MKPEPLSKKWFVPDEPRESDPFIETLDALDEEALEKPLEPLIEETVGLVRPGFWSIGSLMICQALEDGKVPPDALCSWTDNNVVYCLQRRATPRTERVPEGDVAISRDYRFVAATRGIWNFSPNIFCKVKTWNEGLTTEGTTIRWVNKHIPEIPTEEIVYDWIDPEWNRVIMITKRVPGKTLQEAWPSLTVQQRLQVADQLAAYMKLLAEKESDYVETVQGTGLEGEHSLIENREAIPSWMHRIEPRVSREDHDAWKLRGYSYLRMDRVPPGLGERFVLQHGDLNPHNYLVTIPDAPDQTPKITGIIDWERTGYYSRWNVAANPRIEMNNMVFSDPDSPNRDGHHWQWMLSNALVRAGFPLDMEDAKQWIRRTKLRHFPKYPVEWVVNCMNLLTEDGKDKNAEEAKDEGGAKNAEATKAEEEKVATEPEVSIPSGSTN